MQHSDTISGSSEPIFQIIREIEAERDQKPSGRNYADIKVLNLGFDSIEMVELVMQPEDRFGVTLDEQQVMTCNLVSDIVALVDRTVPQ